MNPIHSTFDLGDFKIVGDPIPRSPEERQGILSDLQSQFNDPCASPKNADHPQVIVHRWRSLGHTAAFVDEGIAPLIYALWKRGIGTMYSCQGNPKARGHRHPAYVMFQNPNDVMHFASALNPNAEITKYIAQEVLVSVKKRGRRRRQWVLHRDSWGFRVLIPRFAAEEGQLGGYLEARIAMEFPPKHIPDVVAALTLPFKTGCL